MRNIFYSALGLAVCLWLQVTHDHILDSFVFTSLWWTKSQFVIITNLLGFMMLLRCTALPETWTCMQHD